MGAVSYTVPDVTALFPHPLVFIPTKSLLPWNLFLLIPSLAIIPSSILHFSHSPNTISNTIYAFISAPCFQPPNIPHGLFLLSLNSSFIFKNSSSPSVTTYSHHSFTGLHPSPSPTPYTGSQSPSPTQPSSGHHCQPASTHLHQDNSQLHHEPVPSLLCPHPHQCSTSKLKYNFHDKEEISLSL